jgi:hypothetical protein
MHASDRPVTPTLFQRSVFAWRASFLAEKAMRQQLTPQDEAANATPVKIVKPGKFAGRKSGGGRGRR